MTTLLASSVVRGSHQGESHGGVYRIDLQAGKVDQMLDWNTLDIDWQGRGWDRGLRGIAFDGERIYIAASNELFAYDRSFRLLGSWTNPYLKHCHEISVYRRRLYLSSTGFDSILGFDLDAKRFCFGLQLARVGSQYQAMPFDPLSPRGPRAGNRLHLNNVVCNPNGMYISGLHSGGLLRFDGQGIEPIAALPEGTHNAQPYASGILYNDTAADCVRYVTADTDLSFPVPRLPTEQLTHTDLGDPRVARAGFARGLCAIGEGLIASGYSPSGVAVHDLNAGRTRAVIQLSHDIRNAIHGLVIWPG